MRREIYEFVAAVLRDAYRRARTVSERRDIQNAHFEIEKIIGQLLGWDEYPWGEDAAWEQFQAWQNGDDTNPAAQLHVVPLHEAR